MSEDDRRRQTPSMRPSAAGNKGRDLGHQLWQRHVRGIGLSVASRERFLARLLSDFRRGRSRRLSLQMQRWRGTTESAWSFGALPLFERHSPWAPSDPRPVHPSRQRGHDSVGHGLAAVAARPRPMPRSAALLMRPRERPALRLRPFTEGAQRRLGGSQPKRATRQARLGSSDSALAEREPDDAGEERSPQGGALGSERAALGSHDVEAEGTDRQIVPLIADWRALRRVAELPRHLDASHRWTSSAQDRSSGPHSPGLERQAGSRPALPAGLPALPFPALPFPAPRPARRQPFTSQPGGAGGIAGPSRRISRTAMDQARRSSLQLLGPNRIQLPMVSPSLDKAAPGSGLMQTNDESGPPNKVGRLSLSTAERHEWMGRMPQDERNPAWKRTYQQIQRAAPGYASGAHDASAPDEAHRARLIARPVHDLRVGATGPSGIAVAADKPLARRSKVLGSIGSRSLPRALMASTKDTQPGLARLELSEGMVLAGAAAISLPLASAGIPASGELGSPIHRYALEARTQPHRGHSAAEPIGIVSQSFPAGRLRSNALFRRARPELTWPPGRRATGLGFAAQHSIGSMQGAGNPALARSGLAALETRLQDGSAKRSQPLSVRRYWRAASVPWSDRGKQLARLSSSTAVAAPAPVALASDWLAGAGPAADVPSARGGAGSSLGGGLWPSSHVAKSMPALSRPRPQRGWSIRRPGLERNGAALQRASSIRRPALERNESRVAENAPGVGGFLAPLANSPAVERLLGRPGAALGDIATIGNGSTSRAIARAFDHPNAARVTTVGSHGMQDFGGRFAPQPQSDLQSAKWDEPTSLGVKGSQVLRKATADAPPSLSRELPLVRPAAGPATVEPAVAGNSLAPNSSLGHPQLQAQVAPTAPSPLSNVSTVGPAAAPSSQTEPGSGGDRNLDEVTDKVWRRLLRLLAVERERRGWGRWP